MPFAIGDYEKQLAKMGVMVVTLATRAWRCWMCEKGQLVLSRRVNAEGEAAPAEFICDHCGDSVSIYPDKGGGVQPALKGMKKEDMRSTFHEFGTGGTGYDGRWR